MPLNLKWNTQNYLKGKSWLLVAENLQMTVSFYLCTLFQGKTEGVRDLKSDTSAYLLERVFLLSKGLRAECFFLSFYFFVIRRHGAPPSSLKTMHILPGESSNITTLLHRYSSLGSLTCSHPFPCTPLFSFLCSPSTASPSPVSQSVAPLFIYFPLPSPLDLLYLVPTTFTSLPLLWRRSTRSFTFLPPLPASFSLTFHLHMQVLILKS